MMFTPDARQAQATIDDTLKESYKQVDPEDQSTQEKIDAIDDLLDDPEVKQALLDRMD